MKPAPDDAREVFRGNRFAVVVERWGDREREIVRHPGAVAMVALTQRGDVLLVRQRRESVREVLLELPAGTLDVKGESPEDAARRELLEETGHEASSWERLGSIYSSPGFTDERLELFLARGAEPVGDPEDDIEVVTVTLADARAAVRDGRIADAKSIVALMLAMERLA